MLSVNLITVGKLKENYLREACGEYSKRLGPFCKLNITEYPESRLPDQPSQNDIKNALAAEGKNMLPMLSVKGCYNIAMCIEGKQLSSEKLAEKIEKISVEGKSIINIIIGSSFGISDDIKNMCHMRLSMSEMTFPHHLARIMLAEQIYRGFKIKEGSKYHK